MLTPRKSRTTLRWASSLSALLLFVATVGCSPATDSRLVGKWTGPAPNGTTVTYTFREDGNLDVKLSNADVSFPSKWSALSWEGDDLTIRMSDYQQNSLVRKVRMDGVDKFEMMDEEGKSLGTFERVTGT